MVKIVRRWQNRTVYIHIHIHQNRSNWNCEEKRNKYSLHFEYEATISKRADVFVAAVQRRISEVNYYYFLSLLTVAVEKYENMRYDETYGIKLG